MIHKCTILILFFATGLSLIAQETTPAVPVDPVAAALGEIDAGQLQAASMHLDAITSPPAKLFVQASIERAKGEPKRAIQTIAALVVQYPNDADWTAKGELLTVMLYMELGLPDEADVTARQIQVLYEGTPVATQATGLREKIEKIKEESESKQGNES